MSKFLVGVLLSHETYGSHLDNSGKTIDLELEIKNFFAAMDVVSEIWSESVIDNYPVVCKPVEIGCKLIPDEPEAKWIANHVVQSKYSLQIVKCLDRTCCEEFKTNWNQVFPSRFIPPPVPCKFGPKGLEVVEMSEYKADLKLEMPKCRFASLRDRLIAKLSSNEAQKSQNGTKRPHPFDAYCPSMMEKLDNCVCAKCGSCWPSAAAKTRHLKAHKGWNLRFEFKVLYSSLCTTGNWSKLH